MKKIVFESDKWSNYCEPLFNWLMRDNYGYKIVFTSNLDEILYFIHRFNMLAKDPLNVCHINFFADMDIVRYFADWKRKTHPDYRLLRVPYDVFSDVSKYEYTINWENDFFIIIKKDIELLKTDFLSSCFIRDSSGHTLHFHGEKQQAILRKQVVVKVL